MVVACSNHSISCFAPRISASPKPFKTLELKIPSFSSVQRSPLHCKFSSRVGSSHPTLRSFKSFVRSEESEPETSGGNEHSQTDECKSDGKAGQRRTLELKNLIGVYKEALFDNNEKAASEIEAMLYTLENEKNDLAQKVAALSADIASGKEGCVRLQADFENIRKRCEKDRLRLTSNAQEDVIGSLLAIVDSFEKAKQQARPQTEKGKKIDTSYQGIYKQFVEIMRSLHVSVVETVGKPFNPLFHEAIAREESHQFKEGIIIQEIRRGFLLRDRLLRPAVVKISKGPGHKKAPVAQEKGIGQTTAALD